MWKGGAERQGQLAGALTFRKHVPKTQADFGLARLTSGQPDRRHVSLGTILGADGTDHDNSEYSEYYVSSGGQIAPRWIAPEAAVVNGRFSVVRFWWLGCRCISPNVLNLLHD
jgi:hypothetical protein